MTEIKTDKLEKINGNGNGRVRWKNRRRMAWTSLISMLFITLCLLFAPIDNERLKVVSEPITWFYFASASVIGAYMGFTTWASKK